MATRDSRAAVGERRSRYLRGRLGDELGSHRRSVGLSRREIGRRLGVSPQRIARAEAGYPTALTIDLAARMAAQVGLELAASLHPNGDPVRDKAHLALLARLRSRLPPSARWRVEVPIPIPGDLRSGDAVLRVADDTLLLIEAETHLGDLQLIERRSTAKQRDLGAARLVLLVADTRHNREVIAGHAELHERFPVGTRACTAALRAGRDPGEDALVIL